MSQLEPDPARLRTALESVPAFELVRDAARRAAVETWIVGGAVRDALLGLDLHDLDIVSADAATLVAALPGEARAHDRFGTARVATARGPVDVAQARRERYPHPGALPEVEPADLEDDLARRDFTINAIAVSIADLERPIDPHGGVADLRAGTLRALHEGSFADDPTRAIRAARYAARLGLGVEPQTLAALRRADLATVSEDRAEAELRRLAREAGAVRGFELLAQWGVIACEPDALALIERVVDVVESPDWRSIADRAACVLAAARGGSRSARSLAEARPERPSQGVAAARGRDPVDLVLARALGAKWLDEYVARWRWVRPRISGADLLAAGIEQGPRIGRGLAAALEAALDDAPGTREAELEIALRAARG